jgi:hypothetical protein
MSWNRWWSIPSAIVAIAVLFGAAYGLDHGVYVGSERYVMGAPCCANADVIQKRCRYLFVTGVSEINAVDGQVMAPNAMHDPNAALAGLQTPDNGYCHLFGS